MMKKFLVPLFLGLIITSVEAHEHIPVTEKHSPSHHHHKTISLDESQTIPEIDLIIHKDNLKGWNLEVKLDNFEFAPEAVNQENELNKGHAHLYVNGNKITRIYSNWYYLEDLPSGNNEIKVSLNTNRHEFLMYQGKLIEDIEMIEVE